MLGLILMSLPWSGICGGGKFSYFVIFLCVSLIYLNLYTKMDVPSTPLAPPQPTVDTPTPCSVRIELKTWTKNNETNGNEQPQVKLGGKNTVNSMCEEIYEGRGTLVFFFVFRDMGRRRYFVIAGEQLLSLFKYELKTGKNVGKLAVNVSSTIYRSWLEEEKNLKEFWADSSKDAIFLLDKAITFIKGKTNFVEEFDFVEIDKVAHSSQPGWQDRILTEHVYRSILESSKKFAEVKSAGCSQSGNAMTVRFAKVSFL